MTEKAEGMEGGQAKLEPDLTVHNLTLNTKWIREFF